MRPSLWRSQEWRQLLGPMAIGIAVGGFAFIVSLVVMDFIGVHTESPLALVPALLIGAMFWWKTVNSVNL